MTLTVGTNSYVSETDATTYFETRIDSENWTTATTANKEAALVTATQIIDNNAWIGSAVSSTQALAWPRKNAVYFDNRLGHEITFGNSVTPDLVKTAVYEQALHLIDNEDLLQGKTQTYESISVGSISLSDNNNDVGRASITPAYIMKPLRPLIRRGVNVGMGYSWWRSN
jgi:hypothetical protein